MSNNEELIADAREWTAAVSTYPGAGYFIRKLATALKQADRELADARAEIERLHSWDGLMELLDEHWPESLIPTLADNEERDAGPRIVSLIRWVAEQAATIGAVKAILDEPLDPTQVLDNHPGRALWGATLASRARRILTSTETPEGEQA